jgi:methyltransferase (TIGR00027 family)
VRDAQPSATARRVAIRRAAHQLLDVPPVFDDPLALRIIGRRDADALRANPSRYQRSVFLRYLRAFLAVRHRVAEDALADGIARGVTQYGVLGAGLDTFAYRNTNMSLRVFEVDAPSTQAWKRQLLQDEGIATPSNLTFVPVDFETHSLAEELARAGFDTDAKTVFAWLGVSMYLTLDAVMATLRYIESATANGGGVVFDYASHPQWWKLWQRLGARLLRARVAAGGEPFRTFFTADGLAARLRKLGFTEVENLSGDTLNRRYFANRTDGLRLGTLGNIMSAFHWKSPDARGAK